MFSKTGTEEDNDQPSLPTPRLPKEHTWQELVQSQVKNGKLKCRTCKVYSTAVGDTVDEKTRCVCGRLARRHSFTGKPETQYQTALKWRQKQLAAVVDATIFGQMKNGARVCSHCKRPSTLQNGAGSFRSP